MVPQMSSLDNNIHVLQDVQNEILDFTHNKQRKLLSQHFLETKKKIFTVINKRKKEVKGEQTEEHTWYEEEKQNCGVGNG